MNNRLKSVSSCVRKCLTRYDWDIGRHDNASSTKPRVTVVVTLCHSHRLIRLHTVQSWAKDKSQVHYDNRILTPVLLHIASLVIAIRRRHPASTVTANRRPHPQTLSHFQLCVRCICPTNSSRQPHLRHYYYQHVISRNPYRSRFSRCRYRRTRLFWTAFSGWSTPRLMGYGAWIRRTGGCRVGWWMG